jgi:hypothetical protein
LAQDYCQSLIIGEKAWIQKWRQELETRSGDREWRQEVETGSGDKEWREGVETESGDRKWRWEYRREVEE